VQHIHAYVLVLILLLMQSQVSPVGGGSVAGQVRREYENRAAVCR
jgi:hypothetical protein